KAFNSGDIYGEDTLLHEMAHALWSGLNEPLKRSFSNISWNDQMGRWSPKLQNSKGFISNYAMTSPEEDFAESFSAFIHQPEKLRAEADKKYQWFRSNLFLDTEYFSFVHDSAKVYVPSEKPDVKKPWLLGTTNEKITYEVIGSSTKILK